MFCVVRVLYFVFVGDFINVFVTNSLFAFSARLRFCEIEIFVIIFFSSLFCFSRPFVSISISCLSVFLVYFHVHQSSFFFCL